MSELPSRRRADEVVATALALVEREGEEGLGWNRVARELGVKPPSLYHHVASGADLRRRVAIRGWERFHEYATAAVSRTRSPETELRALATAYRTFAHSHPGLFSVMNTTALEPDDRAFAPVAAAMMALYEAPLTALGVRDARRVHAVRSLRSAIHGFVQLERAGQFAMNASIDISFRMLMDLVIAGMNELAREP